MKVRLSLHSILLVSGRLNAKTDPTTSLFLNALPITETPGHSEQLLEPLQIASNDYRAPNWFSRVFCEPSVVIKTR